MDSTSRQITRPISLATWCVATVALVAGCSPIATDHADPVNNVEQYGVLAAPPLPRSIPNSTFDPTSDLATGDGTTVVSRPDQSNLAFSHGELTQTIGGLPVDLQLRAVSADGTLVALSRHESGASTIVVIDRSSAIPTRRTFDLDGLIEPEAFSTDGGLLFVIDHEVAEPGAYRVRPFDLATGELQDILGPDKRPFDDDMNGVGRRQVWAPDWTRLYTLYVRQTHHHHDDGRAHGHGEPGTDGFVHVLDLDEEWAFCLDLPSAFGGGSLDTTALAVSDDGTMIAVADRTAGQIAFASTDTLAVTRTVELPNLSDDELHIGVSGDHVLLVSDSAGQWYEMEAMTPVGSPIELNSPVLGITSGLGSVLVWPHVGTSGPTEFRPPRV